MKHERNRNNYKPLSESNAMDIQEAVDAVTRSKEFQEFSKKHAESRLVHAFAMHVPRTEFAWELGYYLPQEHLLVVFETRPVKKKEADEPFNEGETIKGLELEKVRISAEEAEKSALDLLVKYPGQQATKSIVVLQVRGVQLYNITLVTDTFNLFNVRVDAATGEIMSGEMRSIMSLRRE